MAKSFALSIAAFAAKAGAAADAVVRKTVLDIGTKIVERSPVGKKELWLDNIDRASRGLKPLPENYVGGRFRANWQYGNYSGAGVPSAELDDIDPSPAEGNVSTARLAAAIPANACGMVHVIINNLPYAEKLENGHSTQAPQGMVGLTVQEFRSIVDAAVASEAKP